MSIAHYIRYLRVLVVPLVLGITEALFGFWPLVPLEVVILGVLHDLGARQWSYKNVIDVGSYCHDQRQIYL